MQALLSFEDYIMIRRISSKLKRTAASLLAAALMLAALPLSGLSAQAYAADQSGTLGEDLVWEITGGVLTIKPAAEGGSGLIPNLAEGKYNVNTAAPCWPWYSCRSQVTEIRIEGNVGGVYDTELRGMFGLMTNLVTADLSGLDMSEVTVLNDAFNGCSKLKTVKMNGIGSLAQWNRCFTGCSALEELSVTNSGLSGISQDTNAFSGVTALRTIDLSGSSLNGRAANITRNRPTLTSLDLSGATIGSSLSADLFEGDGSLTSVTLTDVSGLDSLISSLPSSSISSIYLTDSEGERTVDVSGVPMGVKIQLDGSQKISVTKGEWSFASGGTTQRKLSAEDVAALMTDGKLPEGVLTKTDIDREGSGSIDGSVEWKLEDGKLTIWPTNGTLGYLPSYSNAGAWPWNGLRAAIEGVEVQGRVAAGSDMIDMFKGCAELRSADLSGLDISGCTNISGLFDGCSSIEYLALEFYPQSGTSSVTTVNRLFKGCESLRSLDLSKMAGHLAGLQNENTFEGLSSLETINLTGIRSSGIKLSTESVPNIVTVINNGPGNVLFSLSSNPFTAIGTWTREYDGDSSVLVYDEVLSSNALRPGVYTKFLDTVAGFEKLKDSFYVIRDLGDYRIEINGEYFDSRSGQSTLSERDSSAGYYITRSDNRIDVYSQTLSRSIWETTDTVNKEGEPGHSYDMEPGSVDVKITLYDAAMDANGDRHDVYIEIDDFVIYNPAWVQELGALSEYRRYFLTIDKGELVFRNWVKKDNLSSNGNRGSGTYTDAKVSIEGATEDQSFLFYVDDLDVARRMAENTEKSVYGYPGAEGIELGEGFDLSSAVVADKTWIRTYTYSEEDGYQVASYAYVDGQVQIDELEGAGYTPAATGAALLFVGYDPTGNGDNSTYRTTIFAVGDARGSNFTWQSGVNCDTWFFKGGEILSVWKGLRPVTVGFESSKTLNGEVPDSSYSDLFNFEMKLVRADITENGVTASYTGSSLAGLPLGSSAVNDEGLVSFSRLSFEKIGTYWYEVREIAGAEEDIVYTDQTHELRVEVSGATDDYDMYMGLKAEVYLDGSKVLSTHSSSTIKYSVALASDQISDADIRAAVWKWVDSSDPYDIKTYTYSYDPSTGKYLRSDGALLSAPPANATAEFFPIRTADSGNFNNRTIRIYFPITVSKTVTGNMGDRTREFSFTLTLWSDDGGTQTPYSLDTLPLRASGSDGVYSFSLKHGESITFDNIHTGVHYAVSEGDCSGEGYVTRVSGVSEESRTASGVISDSEVSVGFINEKQGVIPVGLRSGAAASALLFAAGLAGLLLALTRRRIRG